MQTRTLTAPSIHAALIEARRLYGDEVVLLESFPPQGTTPARVTVLADDPAPVRAEAPVPAAFGYHAQQARTTALVADGPPPPPSEPEAPAGPRPRLGRPGGVTPGSALQKRRTEVGRGRLFDPSSTLPRTRSGGFDREAVLSVLEDAFEGHFRKLHARVDALDHRMGTALIGASHTWTAHPLFRALLDQGLQPATAARLFDRLAQQDLLPADDLDAVRWAIAQELRRMLDVAAPRQSTGTPLFIGPSGAGKTALLLKLARHPNFYGRHKATVISIAPADERRTTYQSPVELFRRFGLPTQSVQHPEEMAKALHRVRRFDQILIDTPPLPLDEGAAKKMLLRIKRMVDPIMPLSVHLVLSTARSLDAFDPQTLKRLPLKPTAVALTHLDETFGWGRVAEWMIRLQLPVQFVSNGPGVPDGVQAFTPSWFVEEMMTL
ncbi:MAG: flagellar biosynthesis protein FlhF [Bacteroidota bacterium]